MQRKPNILFFLPDQHRPDWLGINTDLPLRTPNLDRLSRKGVTFTKAHTPSPVCAPARACLASGLDYEKCGVPSNKENYPLDQPTYYQRLRDAGYRVCGVGKFDLHKDLAAPPGERDWYLDGSRLLAEWGFTEGIDNEGKFDGSAAYRNAGKPKGPYLNFLKQRGLADIYEKEHTERKRYKGAYVTALPEDAYCDNWIAENGLAFLREFPENQPWHLVVNFTGPHNPMDVTQKMHDAWRDVDFPPPAANEQTDYSSEDHQRNRRHYAAMLENIDRQVGRFIQAVEERGELKNTLIVYSSDHGEMLGDHSRWGKGVWYEASSGVPLIIAGPGIVEGKMSEALVSLHDLTATFLELSDTPPLPEMESRSLLPLLKGNTREHRKYLRSGLREWRMVYDGRYKLVTGSEPEPLLFDLEEDPRELVNRAQEMPVVVARLKENL
jgi:arylsulfatase